MTHEQLAINYEQLPPSYAQQRLWFLDQLESDSGFYNISLAFRLEGKLKVRVLEKSLGEIINRHEALRTNFITVEGQPVQIIHPEKDWQLTIVKGQELINSGEEESVDKWIQNQSVQPFDLVNEPLIRVTLLEVSETEHRLLICLHHIVADGWSMEVFVRELTTLYRAYAQGLESPLSELPIQYGDFAIWQRDWLQGDVLQNQLNYWQEQLADAPALLNLPTDRPRPPMQTFVGEYQEFTLAPEVTQGLTALSKEEGVTLFMTLLAAFDVLLYRYTGQTDIVVGTPTANRNHSELEGLIGFFVNTLVLRTDLEGNPSFKELLNRVREKTLEAYSYENLPFEMLVEALQPERNLSHTPLFQVMFGMEKETLSTMELEGIKVTHQTLENNTAKFDLTLVIKQTESGLSAVWEYNTDLFDHSTIERLSAHFEKLLKGIIANPEKPISQLPLLTETEEQQILVDWNQTQVDYPGEFCLHQLFEQQVERNPEAIAVRWENESLTYGELNQRANQLAHHLQSLGVKVEQLVGILVERSLEMIVGILGILKAGGAYVPLDPNYPQERLSFMLDDAQVSVMLTQQQLLESLPPHQAQVICLDSDWETIAQSSESNPNHTATPDNLAYVIYTSGSTGKPKGVLVNHSNVVRLFAATEDWYHFNEQDVWTLFHSIAFDFSVWEIWGALLYGGRLVVVPYLVTRSPESFYELLCKENVTVLNQTPSAFRQLIQAEPETGSDLKLRQVIFGGEALEINSLQPWFERHGDQTPQLVNMYGITETTVHVTYRPLSLADLERAASVIGRPIPDLQMYVLDEYLQPVPIGVPGEMYVGGAGVTRGYLNRGELTAERFISSPLNNSKLYKTGDLARYLPNGELEYLGRIDNQVKIRGFRIELGEIEALLTQHPDVWESVAVVREDEPGNKRLVAYVVPKGEQSPTVAQLRQFLTNQLPSYMVPNTFVLLESLPLTANGKVDRRALPAPDSIRPELEDVFVAPSKTEEKILAAIWSKILGIEQVGIHDNFFALGGDSIRSIQVLSQAREQGLNFSVQQLFQEQTIHELVQKLTAEVEDSTKLELTQPFSLISPADKQQLPDGIEDAYPLAMLQMGMFYHSEYSEESAIYHEISSYHFKTPLNVELLQVALQALVNHHDILRTSFDLSNYSIPLQLVHQQVEIPLEVEDWSHLNPSEQEEALDTWFESEKKHHFDWTHAPLIRFFVHRRSQETFNLTFSCHHAILDGWSVSCMITELLQRYFSLLGLQTEYVAAPLSLRFRDFVALEQQAIASADNQQYWSEKLHDITVTQLPRWSSESKKTDGHKVNEQDITLTPELCQGLRQLAQSQEVPLKTLLLAAHLRVLSFVSGQSDVLTGLVANGRPEQSDGDRILGLFLNTLPFRLQLNGGTWIDLVRQVFAAERELLSHRRYPLAEIQRSFGGEPLFEAAFNFVNFHIYQQVLGLSHLQFLGGKFFEETDFTFTAQFAVNPNTYDIHLKIDYDALKLCPEQVNRISEYYLNALVAMVRHPEERYELSPLFPAEEQKQLLDQWNNTETDYPVEQCVHHLFEEQVQRTPDGVAVVFESQSLTYQELNIQANQLAHYLQSQGVNSEVYVGIYLERSLSIIVALLAILKAGGTYVPLDPDYPTQRLAYIATDSQFKLLITQESLRDTLPTEGLTVISLDSPREIFTIQNSENPVSQVAPKNLACILYTSGSTGKPKGVMLAHQALVNHSWAISEVFGLSTSDRVLQFASFSFDVAAEEIFPTWLTGGTVVLRPVQMFATMTDLADFIESESISVVNITPAYWHEWAVAVSQGIATVPRCLRVAAVGGDAVIPETVTIWKKWVGERVNCLNVYGPTEASVTAIVHDLLDIEAETINSVLIGRPIPNTKAYILDANLQPVPIGARGELHLCGTRLARGYLNRPDLTAEKFIDNPFALSPTSLKNGNGNGNGQWSRLYKTGDVACYLPDGSIECFGRIDNQVKIRGFRIELGEIEAVLNQNPDIQASCVIIREDTPGDKYIVAYVVSHYERIPLISDLRQYLASQLPLYMVPQAFVFLEALPLTPNRKVDRRALPAPDLYHDLRAQYVAPRNPMEEILTQIWTQILKVEQVGIHDNFFEIGGHSLLATQLVSRIRSLFKVEMPLRSIFGAATVAELAHLVTELQQQEITPQIPEILPRTESTELVTSFAQTRLWFLDQLQPHSALYNIPLALRLEGKINQEALEASLKEINQRHEVLRTNFPNIKGQPTPVINSGDNWQVSIVDWRNLSSVKQEKSIQEFVSTQSQKPFDLANDELFRASLVLLSETEQILFICIHHIVSDGWSMEVLIEELTNLYSAYSQGQPANLAPLPIQYADFALWQQQWLQGEVLENQLNYWQQQLADAPALLNLPTDRPRPPMQTFTGAYQEFTLSPETTQGLIALSKQEGVTLFMTLLAAFDVLLCRYTGETDIVVGTPIANRNHGELEGLIGFFANTLVLRTDLADNPSFKELLTQVRTMAMDAYAHQDLPFEMLVEALQPERNLSHNPLFQVAFLLHNMPSSQVEVPDLVIQDLSLDNTLAKFDLTLAMQNTDQGLVGVLEYNTDLFDSGTIERMAGHFVTLLEGIVAHPQEQVGQLPLLTPVEEKQLLVEWNQTQVDYPQHLCIHQLFEEQVLRSPNAIAVVFEEQQLTYGELNQKANQLGHYLRSQGVTKGKIVGLCVERSLEMMIGLLGILKAGCAYLPLDPEYPPERLSYMIEDGQISVLLTQEGIVEKLPATQAALICFEEIQEQLELQPSDNLDEIVTPRDLAYLIYTSGSTGRPKGVMVEHKGLYNQAQVQIKTFKLSSNDRILQFASLSFDACIWEILTAGGVGATLYLGTKDTLAPGAPLVQRLKDYGITWIVLPPSALAVLPEEELPELQTIVVGGEACSLELAKKWSGGRNFFNAYGPTEASVCVTIIRCSEEQDKITIGRPLANTQAYILDSQLQPVPIGVPGELHIGGVGLARGYLNRPELTREKFISNPFSDDPAAKLYKTGDLARYLPNGNIEYLGRIDHQVKIRGFRIELGEIEALLNQQPEVQNAYVMTWEDRTGNNSIVAYLVPSTEVKPATSELRQILKAQLPQYMIPSAFVWLEALPLTPNGKVDRRALPNPEPDRDRTNNLVLPRNTIEEKLALIWSEVLKIEPIGIYDNFFDLGGHSLLATQVISRAQETFEVSLSLRSLFESPTIAEFSQAIAHQLQAGAGLKLPPIAPVSRDADIPLSWAQERLWFVNQLEGDSGAYTIDLNLRLRGNLDLKAFEQAFQAIVQRHEPLRTQFKLKDSKPIQAIAPESQFTLPIVDLQNFADTGQQLKLMVAEAVSEPFDLANGSVLRVKLWQVARDEYVLLLAIHHIAADGWSMGVLVNELSAHYRAYAMDSPLELPELKVQYADFALWQRQWLTTEVLERQLNYWKEQLTGAPPLLELPTDRPRPAIQTFQGGTELISLKSKLTQKLQQIGRESGATLFMVLLASFAVLLSRYSEQDDLVIASPIANRNRQEVEPLIGFFVNTLALRFDLSPEQTFNDLLEQVREVTQNAYDHQDLPFEMLVEELQVERHLDRNPLAQVMFALQNAPSSPWDLPGLTIEPVDSGLDAVRVDLEVHLWEVGGGIEGDFAYNRDLFDGTTIARLINHFKNLLTAIAENPQLPISQIPLLSPGERQQLLTTWNDTQVDYPADQCIHQLIEEQVERTPDGVAVVFEEQQLTYAELNRRANQLAHYLITLGVKPDSLVGICVERSPLMIIGLLAILKAGGAYVPLDPEYPTERLSLMLEDTQVDLLLTQTSLADTLPPHQAKVIFLDDLESQIAPHPEDNPQSDVKPNHLANVIYTSGSTGKPKGVMVEHQGLFNLAQAQIETFGLQPDSRVLQFASFSFDACISEILMSLGSGAILYLGSKDSFLPGNPLISQLEKNIITHITLPPSALAVLPHQDLPDLKTIIVAGEACSPELVKQWSVGRNFFNGYGPTEASVCATIARCCPEDDKVSIGRPIANVQVHILDSHLEPVPIGVAGELHIGGIGLARGYLNRPELTVEKFIPNPFGESDEDKLYKTGDKARYLPDGEIEYLGRIDHQVKVRGFRIETGEIETVLTRHPLVQESVVIAREDIPGDKRLVAYLVPGQKKQALDQLIAWQTEYVRDWQSLYEQSYSRTLVANDDPTFNIAGWNSSYTRQPIPPEEMRVWVESTVSRILSLAPQRVLEIGCGSGLFVYRVAPHCQEYWATDYSKSAVDYVEQVCSNGAGLNNVKVRQQKADNFTGIPQGKFDTIVLNSVIQYFPSVEYLLEVIEGAIATIDSYGSLFLGDVRSLPLLEPYHAAVQLSQATEETTVTQWQQQVSQSIASEEELVIDPRFFLALQQSFPKITGVEIEPKRGDVQNELFQFRYDVTLHLGKPVEMEVVSWLNWQLDSLSLTKLQQRLEQEQPEFLGIRQVPNQRVQEALTIWQWRENPPPLETVAELRQELKQRLAQGINPESLGELGDSLGYSVRLSWWSSSQEGCFDVVFCRNGSAPKPSYAIPFAQNSSITAKSWTDYTNNPLQGKLVQKLVPQVREFSQEKLPNYMIPQTFVLLNALPLTPNGKIDRRALPAPDTASRNVEIDFVSPHTPLEAQLVQIWSEVLGISKIGIKDNFFELGGHSLLATQVIYRLRDIFALEISLQNFLEYPTIAGLSQIIEVLSSVKEPQVSTTETDEDYEEGEI